MSFRRLSFAVAVIGTLALLLLHASVYRFLSDDAYIGFRYVSNLVEGHGLVFNPGEPVEGYTNFLWLVILAGLRQGLGVAPETVANPLLIVCTIGLWALVARASIQAGGPDEPRWPALIPLTLLAFTRSVAVWSTSGLETRFFELLVLAAVLRLIQETQVLTEGARPRPLSGALFALATLTRPEAALLGGASLLAAWVVTHRDWRRVWPTWALQGLLFAVPVVLHLAWRHAFYGEWLPNTFYAKVDGFWWDMGARYFTLFALEYGVLLWLPLLALAIAHHRRRRTLHVPLIFTAVILPHAVYVASIGGDHFEYRPIDLYLPLLFLLMGDGVRELRARILALADPRRPAVAGLAWGYGALVLLALTWIPWQAHRQFPSHFIPGFPGIRSGDPANGHFLDPIRDPVLRFPVLRQIAAAHRRLLYSTTASLVGIRAEEHRLFVEAVEPTGIRLRNMMEAGVLPADAHIATDAAGVIPYRSGLRTLDRLGLNDRVVARSEVTERRTMAHDHRATLAYAVEKGVDLWAEDPVHLLFTLDEDRLAVVLEDARRVGRDVYFAYTGDAVLAVQLPMGEATARARFPRLELRSLLRDSAAAAELDTRMRAARQRRLAADPGSVEARLVSALSSAERGDTTNAIRALEALQDTEDPWVLEALARLYGSRGRHTEAANALRRAVAVAPDLRGLQFNFGVVLAQVGEFEEARAAFRRAAEIDPTDPQIQYALGSMCYVLADRACLAKQFDVLQRIGTRVALDLLQELRRIAGP